MKIASWNVNSLRVRLPHVLEWLAATKPDLLALQETKVPDEEFPRIEIEAAGYHAVYSGQKGYNGVAILSRKPPRGEAVTTLPGVSDGDKRVLCADYGKLRLVNVYVPNGKEVGSDAYAYKLEWLAQLARFLRAELTRHPQLVLVGDLNIAPDERDVYKPLLWENQILYSAPERAAFHSLLQTGMVDIVRAKNGDQHLYSWWDYRFRAFEGNRGLRIDHILVSPALAARCTAATIDRAPRSKPRPSDHAPVIGEFTAS
jgi:exodeoxyribonuclease-3